jgi:ribosomal protein S18 acetylase RimI-like enzyme
MDSVVGTEGSWGDAVTMNRKANEPSAGIGGQTPPGIDSHVKVVRIDERMRRSAAIRLIGQGAASLGIDVSLMWATMEPDNQRVRQVCMVVCGAGRTAMLFLSPDVPGSASAGSRGAETALRERIMLITTACELAGQPLQEGGKGIRLVQALLEPRETSAASALRGAGFLELGALHYLRLALRRAGRGTPDATVPEALRVPGIELRRVDELTSAHSTSAVDAMLAAAMERSYEQTLDCPELCGLRDVHDVLASHKSVGTFDPSLWWVVLSDGRPEGCMMLSRCPEQETVELVYLGVSPAIRGRGIGGAMLRVGCDELARRRIAPTGGLTCAVDTRNVPALRLYESMGFASFATRLPLVKGLAGARPG